MVNESGVEVPFFLRKSFEGDEIPQDDTNMKELFWYMRNCAVGSMAKKLDHTLISSIRRLNIEFTSKVKMKKKGSVEEHSIQNRKELIKLIKKNRDFPKGSDFEKNLSFAKQEFDLDEIDIKILTLILSYKRNHKIELFSDLVLKRLQNAVSAVAALLNVESDCVKKKISAEGNLSTSGLIKINEYSNDRDFSGDGGCFQISSHFSQVMGQSYTTRKKLVEALIGKPVTTSLTWDDFEHLGEIRNLVAKVVLGGKRQSATGINILLYGPVGTGKTEFAKALAAHVSQTIWSVGETDDVGGEPMRGERIDMLKILQKLLSRKKDAILLFDEAEDILSSERDWFGSFSRSSRQSKVYLNRIIEQSTIPVIWTCNDVETIHPAILRRMTMAIEVKTSGRSSQEKIWKSALEHADFNLSQDAIMRLAERYAAPASVISNALKVGKLSKGGEAEVEEAMTSVLRMLNIIPNIAEPNIAAFEPKLVNSESNLVHLVEQLTLPTASRQWSLCLYGPPGTGKSQFARYLADKLGMEIMHQRASNLLSSYVGGSEKQIASAFQTARSRRAMLIIDEADSLLADRHGARYSWEVSQVNEMLTWMEAHPYPFVCTTNLMDRLDPASLRRFTLKLKFESLKPAQAKLAFESFFGVAAPRELAEGLTLGDFSTVARKRTLFGTDNPTLLAQWLDEEAEAKGIRLQRIGFGRSYG